jgi:hypothetical protein
MRIHRNAHGSPRLWWGDDRLKQLERRGRWWAGGVLLICCLLLASTSGATPLQVVLQGQVRDPLGNPLAGTLVTVRSIASDRPTRVLQCDAAGRFRAALPSGRYAVRVTRVDRIAWETTLPLRDDAHPLLIVLHAKPLRTAPVRVAAPRHEVARSTDATTLHPEDLDAKVGGFEDVLRSVQDLPGVSAASDLQAEFSVRGSHTSANAVYLDGIEIMFPFHILGFNSIFGPGMVRKADFWSANAPLGYSGASGGVLAVESRGGRPGPTTTQVGLSWLSGQVQAAAATERTGVVFGMRRSYHDKLVQLLGEVPNQQIPSFHELHLRGHWVPQDGHLLSVGYLLAGDGLSIPSPELQAQNYSLIQSQGSESEAETLRQTALDTRGGRLWVDNSLQVFSVQHSTSPTPRVHLQTTLGWVPQSFHFGLRTKESERADVQSSVWTLRQSARWRGKEQTVQFGWRLYRDTTRRKVHAHAGLLHVRQANTSLHLHDQHERYSFNQQRRRGAAMFHATHIWHPNGLPGEWQTGMRFEHDTLTGETFVDPRLSLTWNMDAAWQIQASWGTAHTLRDKFVELMPTRSGAPLGAESATMRTLGLTGSIDAWRLGGTLWSKSLSNLPYEIEPAYYASGAEGKAKGADVWLEWALPRRGWTSRLQYSWSRTLQRNPVMFRRNALPGTTPLSRWEPLYEAPFWYHPEHDVRHQLSWQVRIERGPWQFGSQLRMQSGRPWTPVAGVTWDYRNWPVGIEAPRGSARLPGYFRWDVRFARHFRAGPARWNVYAEVLNLTQAHNVYQYRYDPHYESLVGIMMLPALPTLGFEATF